MVDHPPELVVGRRGLGTGGWLCRRKLDELDIFGGVKTDVTFFLNPNKKWHFTKYQWWHEVELSFSLDFLLELDFFQQKQVPSSPIFVWIDLPESEEIGPFLQSVPDSQLRRWLVMRWSMWWSTLTRFSTQHVWLYDCKEMTWEAAMSPNFNLGDFLNFNFT